MSQEIERHCPNCPTYNSSCQWCIDSLHCSGCGWHYEDCHCPEELAVVFTGESRAHILRQLESPAVFLDQLVKAHRDDLAKAPR